jgi:hypothetical protein
MRISRGEAEKTPLGVNNVPHGRGKVARLLLFVVLSHLDVTS